MKLKLVIDGENQRVRITPNGKADVKLLEYITEFDIARVSLVKDTYSRETKHVDLKLEVELIKDENGDVEVKHPLVPESL